ncbi:MAG: hypothetical protein GX251_08455 [Firmicutes bacterium]|nr:hypothetical protein [Bacillota bacterium]
MTKKQDTRKIVYLGLLLLAIGLVIVGIFLEGRWTGVLIGLGAGLLGVSGAQLITERVMQGNPELKRKVRVEELDERNIQINQYAKAKAFDFFQFLALPFFLVLVVADVPLWIVLLAIAVYVADWAVYLWFLTRRMNEI